MSEMSRRQMMRGALLGAASMGVRGLARGQQSVPEVTRAGAPGSTILPPNGVEVPEPRLTDVRRVIVDTDPGNDDALAILMALSARSLEVDAVTVCPGNMGIEGYDQQVRNALYMVDLAGASGRVPVYRGMGKPILGRPFPVASFIHGEYGLGEVEVTTVKQSVEPEHAVDAMRRIVNGAPGEVTILALGGLTNVAMAILRDEAFVRNLRGVIFVGGKYEGPGFSPGYNVLVDPEAAEVVVRSGVPLLMVGGRPTISNASTGCGRSPGTIGGRWAGDGFSSVTRRARRDVFSGRISTSLLARRLNCSWSRRSSVPASSSKRPAAPSSASISTSAFSSGTVRPRRYSGGRGPKSGGRTSWNGSFRRRSGVG